MDYILEFVSKSSPVGLFFKFIMFLGFLVFLTYILGEVGSFYHAKKMGFKKKGRQDKDPIRIAYYEQFRDYLRTLHLIIGEAKSCVNGGVIYDSVGQRIVANFKYVNPKDSKLPFGLYQIDFIDKTISAQAINYVIKPIAVSNPVGESSVKKTDGSNNQPLLEPVCNESQPREVVMISKYALPKSFNYHTLEGSKELIRMCPISYNLPVQTMDNQTMASLDDITMNLEQPVPATLSDNEIEIELDLIAGRAAKKTSHKFMHGNRVKPQESIVVAKKRKVIELDGADKNSENYKDHILEIHKGDLLIPLYNIAGSVINYQVIHMDQTKRFRIGKSIKGGSFVIGGAITPETNEYILCEDYLTGDVLHRITGKSVVVCFDIQNIKEMGIIIRGINKNAKFIIATAKDMLVQNKPRIRKALDYALHFNAPFIFPKFPTGKKYSHYKTWSELQKFVSDNEMKNMVQAQLNMITQQGVVQTVSTVAQKFGV